jgi:serine phosphatase RsbU (regulator of sigma subunit)
VLITDGVLGSGRPRLELSGFEAVLRSCQGMSPRLIAARINASVTSQQSDDVAILVVKVRS